MMCDNQLQIQRQYLETNHFFLSQPALIGFWYCTEESRHAMRCLAEMVFLKVQVTEAFSPSEI